MSDIPRNATDASREMSVAELCDLLEVEEIDRDLYRGKRKKGGVGRIFGGQVIAQALMSAIRSMESPKVVHSLHAYFMRPGDEDLPIIFRVERDFDGGSFANRRVIAIQKGQPILNFAASFQVPEDGMTHSVKIPHGPAPEDLASIREIVQRDAGGVAPVFGRFLAAQKAIDVRPVDPAHFSSPGRGELSRQCWLRVVAPVAGGQTMHRVMLAYISDLMLLSASTLPHLRNIDPTKMQVASLDHALWFHEDVGIDDWLLYAMESPWAGHARGYSRGTFFTRDGTLVASVTQEGLIRQRR